KLKLPLDEPVHPQVPRRAITPRYRAVSAHIERVHGGQRPLGQGSEIRLGVERVLLVHDEICALSVPAQATRISGFTRRGGQRSSAALAEQLTLWANSVSARRPTRSP